MIISPRVCLPCFSKSPEKSPFYKLWFIKKGICFSTDLPPSVHHRDLGIQIGRADTEKLFHLIFENIPDVDNCLVVP